MKTNFTKCKKKHSLDKSVSLLLLREILLGGAVTFTDGQEGIFTTIRFTVDENFDENETTVNLEKLRWNENEIMENVSSTTLTKVLAVGDENMDIPNKFGLSQNYPNPFNSVTTISYQSPKSSFVNLSIYNIAGQLVETLVNEYNNAGFHTIEWNASRVGSGVYFYRIEAGEYMETKKCLILN